MMKHFKKIIYIFFILCFSVNSYSYKYLSQLTEWPFAPIKTGLSPAPETILFGMHSNTTDAPDGVIFWAVGDTLSIINAATMTSLSSVIIPTESYINAMHYDGERELLYVGAGRANKHEENTIKGGMLIYNVSDVNNTPVEIAYINSSPNNPGLLPDKNSNLPNASIEIPEIDGYGIAYFKGLVFLADTNFGLRVIDVSNLDVNQSPPQLLSEISYLDNITGTEYISFKRCNLGDTCTTTGGFLNLKLIDVIYEGTPKIYLLVHDYYWGLRFFDVTGLYNTEDPAAIIPNTNATNDDLIEVADKDLRTSLWIGSLSLVSGMALTEAPDKADTLYAYVSSTNSSLTQSVMGKLEIYLDKLTPDYVFPYDGLIAMHPIINYGYAISPGFIGGFDVSGDYSFVADGGKGLQIADMVTLPPEYGPGNPYNPLKDPKEIYEIVGGLDSALIDTNTVPLADAYSCAKAGNFAYLGTTSIGLHKIETTIITTPQHNAYLDPTLTTDAVSVDGNYMYTLDQDFGIRVFDITMDTYLSLKAVFDNNVDENGVPASRTAYDIVASSNYAFIANGPNGLRILNLFDPTTPALEIDKPVAGTAVDIDVQGRYAYIAAQDAGLAVIEVTRPDSPGDPAYLDTAGSAESVFADGSFTYIADGTNGLVIADVSDKTIPPVEAGQINITGTSVSVAIDRQDIDGDENIEILAYVVSDTGVHVVDVSDPLNPVIISTWSTPDGTPTDMVIFESIGYVAMGTEGIRILYLDLNLDDEESPPILTESPTSHYAGTDNAKALFTINEYLYVADGKGGVSILGMYDSTSDSGLGAHYPTSSSDSYCFISTLY